MADLSVVGLLDHHSIQEILAVPAHHSNAAFCMHVALACCANSSRVLSMQHIKSVKSCILVFHNFQEVMSQYMMATQLHIALVDFEVVGSEGV